MQYEYFINLEERGEFYADVRNESGETVFEMKSENGEEFWLIEQGHMRHSRHIDGLAGHLITIGIMQETDELVAGNFNA